MARMKIGRRNKWKTKNIYFISAVFFIALTIQTLWFIEFKIEPVLRNYANIKVIEIATDAINDAINKKIAESDDFDQLVYKTFNKNGDISSIYINVRAVNRIQAQATQRVQARLEELSKEQISVPLGVALNSSILASYGPKIPISLVPIGAVEVELRPELNSVGINVVQSTIYLNIKARVKVVIPFSSDEALVEQKVILDNQIIPGDVPMYYINADFQKNE